MQDPLLLFPTEEMKEKLAAKAKDLGMTNEEYIEYLIDNDYQEEEDEEEEENEEEEDDQFSEILQGITDVSDKDSIIKELKNQVLVREQEIFNITQQLDNVTNYTRINVLFDVVRGHTLLIDGTREKLVMRTKADFIHCLVKNFFYTFDSEDFGVDEDEFKERVDKSVEEEESQEHGKDDELDDDEQ